MVKIWKILIIRVTIINHNFDSEMFYLRYGVLNSSDKTVYHRIER